MSDNLNVISPQFLHMLKNKEEKFGFSAFKPFNNWSIFSYANCKQYYSFRMVCPSFTARHWL